MPRNRRRIVSILCLLAFLALPLMAQPTRESSDFSILSLVSAVWERLTGAVAESPSLTSTWEADGVTESAPPPPSSPIETGRGGWDPNG